MDVPDRIGFFFFTSGLVAELAAISQSSLGFDVIRQSGIASTSPSDVKSWPERKSSCPWPPRHRKSQFVDASDWSPSPSVVSFQSVSDTVIAAEDAALRLSGPGLGISLSPIAQPFMMQCNLNEPGAFLDDRVFHVAPVASSTPKADMTLIRRTTRARSDHRILAWSAAAACAVALGNHAAARLAERLHPPEGSFIEVDGVRLHYRDRGVGSPVVLIHGDGVTGEDYNTSGVTELLLKTHRVLIFDRPGFGYSERPRGRLWTANEQAELLYKALCRLEINRPVVVGHSWGAIVALALAEAHPTHTGGLVLLSGYYFWTLRPDVAPATLAALPLIGDILRYTVSPLLGWLTMPIFKRMLFSPAPVPARFRAEYSPAMALRPSQIRATSLDGALMIPSAVRLRGGYEELSMPVIIMAGEGDKVVFKKSAERLQASIKNSALRIVKGAGHMVHYSVPQLVAEAVEEVAKGNREDDAVPRRALASMVL